MAGSGKDRRRGRGGWRWGGPSPGMGRVGRAGRAGGGLACRWRALERAGLSGAAGSGWWEGLARRVVPVWRGETGRCGGELGRLDGVGEGGGVGGRRARTGESVRRGVCWHGETRRGWDGQAVSGRSGKAGGATASRLRAGSGAAGDGLSVGVGPARCVTSAPVREGRSVWCGGPGGRCGAEQRWRGLSVRAGEASDVGCWTGEVGTGEAGRAGRSGEAGCGSARRVRSGKQGMGKSGAGLVGLVGAGWGAVGFGTGSSVR